MRQHLTRLALALGIGLVPAFASAHPLDPLTPDEIRAAGRIARMDARLADAQFASILLNEPAKAAVLDWRTGQLLARQARLSAMTPATVFESSPISPPDASSRLSSAKASSRP